MEEPRSGDKEEIGPDASPAKALFRGVIDRSTIWPFPSIEASQDDTVAMVVDTVDKFLADKQGSFKGWDEIGEQPQDFLEELRGLGLFGVIIPEEYGGIGLSNAGYSRVLQQSSRHDSSVSLTIGAHSSIGMKGLLLYGSEEQKQKYLPRLAAGELIAAFCLTEPGSGSDAASIKTSASRDGNGEWILNGEKTWITNGGIADLYTVFARTQSAGGKLSAFIVERAFDGVSVGPKEDKLGIRASSTTTVSFVDVKVPAENLLGEEGKGFKTAMEILNNGRTGLGGGAVGGMKTCIALAAQQAMERKQFGQSIGSFGLIKQKIARMTIDCFAAESVVWMVAHYIDSGHQDYATEAAISKVFASEAMRRAADEALQIAAGSGYMKELPYERIWRDARILTIFEGTSEILRLFIALSGVREAGRLLEELGAAASDIFNDPIKGFGMLRRHGKSIVDKQFALERLANLAIDLFVGLCTLSRVSAMPADGSQSYEQGVSIAHQFSQMAKRRMSRNVRAMLRNEDEHAKSLAQHIFDNGAYTWDTIGS